MKIELNSQRRSPTWPPWRHVETSNSSWSIPISRSTVQWLHVLWLFIRTSYEKETRGCKVFYKGQGKNWPITDQWGTTWCKTGQNVPSPCPLLFMWVLHQVLPDRRVPSNDPRNNWGTHFGSSPLLVSIKEANHTTLNRPCHSFWKPSWPVDNRVRNYSFAWESNIE